MTKKIHTINDLSDEYVIDLLKRGLSDVDEIFMENYSPSHSNHPANLFYILQNGRYKNCQFFVIEEDGEFVACSGWNEFDSTTALLLTRTYVTKNRRAQRTIAENFLPIMLESTKHYDKVWITFNSYNKHIYDWFCSLKNKQLGWLEVYAKFEPIGMLSVNNVDQYVVQLKCNSL